MLGCCGGTSEINKAKAIEYSIDLQLESHVYNLLAFGKYENCNEFNVQSF